MQTDEKYEAVIGLEVHAQLSTKSKLFSADPNSFGAEANQNVSIISLGHPGSLPRLNEQVVESAIKLGLATQSTIAPVLGFARKNYFYTDLPKGYQISQHESPICEGGRVSIRINGESRDIHLTRIHIEEDAGKSLHDQQPDASFIDLNRAGVPLLEIVSEPELRSAEEAQAYLGEIRRMVRYLDVCDGNMEEGSLRCDANVSIKKKTDTVLGTRTEIKNLNSISNVGKAIEYEIKRQTEVLNEGKKVKQETVSYDDQRNLCFPLRSKEEADDYRYFPEPDLNPLLIKEELISRIRSEIPALPNDYYNKFTGEFKLNYKDAEALIETAPLAEYYQELASSSDPKSAANWIMGPIKSWLNENNKSIQDFPVRPAGMKELIRITAEGLISYTAAQQKLFPELIKNPSSDPGSLASSMDLVQESSEDIIMKQVRDALDKYPEKIIEYNKGKKGLLGLFMGEVMKISGGKADPALTNKIIRSELENRK